MESPAIVVGLLLARRGGSGAGTRVSLLPHLRDAMVDGTVALAIAAALNLGMGNALFCTLCASASYIAVPAARRHAITQADPGLYVTSAIALTFPSTSCSVCRSTFPPSGTTGAD